MKPLIAVTTDVKVIDPYRWHATPSSYFDAVVDVADGLAVLVPNLGERLDIEALLDRVDGVLVTGSRSNVHPSHYGAEPSEDHQPFDKERDATTLPLIRATVERGVPLLAICRGIQEMNVALGGSITAAFQKAREIEDHSYPWEGTMDERFALAHDVAVEPGSCLDRIFDGELVRVNSLHTQALDRVADVLTVEAVHKDGTIEGVSVTGAPGFAVGVQWHPEYWAATETASNKLLRAFGDAARDYAAAKSAMPLAAE
ncbi:MAG: gamma-glutamyl-gamma-aminobutyrate hydrolase family protein [Ahrensia sp.]|nr:gamma-glutamyl-gamma-aminobutyrate hydrolase family protein [Ahrensia sp.]